MNPKRAAAIDIGTNSVRLLIAQVGLEAEKPELETLHRIMNITRLGEGVDESDRLKPDAIERTLRILKSYSKLMRQEAVQGLRLVATSAVRDAANAGEFVDRVRKVVAAEPEVITGEEEAALSFLGATYDLDESIPGDGPILVVDLGGGSTEIIVGREGEIIRSYSADVGCVRMSERFLKGDPPSRRERDEMETHIASVLAPIIAEVEELRPVLMVGLAGTMTTLSGLRQGLDRYDGEAIHHSWLKREDVEELYEKLYKIPVKARREMMKLEPGRADVIIGGTAVLLVLLGQLNVGRFLVSEKDILDGLVIEVAFGRILRK
ncbi:MAG: hypothetical protein A2Y75_00700 [Candidatus Solincola sediminis]|uniref:Ppx/GppA phosphatase N-terminal domain-containing protein n=1 Tax=Candidatus Solincola sediminis TaxID=1797199 RepID=A0A1F2WQB9_9ACTN|nr:MAG: hypothetical protein A2Y75_00700 [Candidatus Solincola sediminis]